MKKLSDKKRVNVYVTPETYAKLMNLAEKMGNSQSGVASLAIDAGLVALDMAFNPNWTAYFEQVMKTGTKPETFLKGSESEEIG